MAKILNNNSVYYAILFASMIFFGLYFKNFFIEQYIRFALRDSYIVVSMTTTPHRINRISQTLNSILQQNAPVKQIFLNVPYIFKRDNIAYEIPAWIKNHKKITIIRCEDYGPATKLLGLLKNIELPEQAIIISLDDDIVYPKNIVLQLAYESQKQPEYAIGLSGADIYTNEETIRNIDKRLGLKSRYDFSGHVAILQGYAGIAYRANFFNADIFEIENFPSECKNSDDLYFAFYLAKHNIERKTFSNEFISTRSIQANTKFAIANDALQRQIPLPPDKHKACLAFLRNNYASVNF